MTYFLFKKINQLFILVIIANITVNNFNKLCSRSLFNEKHIYLFNKNFITSATLLNRTTLLFGLTVPESSLSVPEVKLGFLMGT